ncbi:unnamed protein product [Protopolystoma xenopodis]|uniref:Fibronectin type-III domain-containing protein n=1 Tax=Protopolystoma xenopodis TaxID=117903 RepID=A0A3S5FGH5_9PLAT|nr:unnamed protein product [Protopolystoma xenopodis]
MYSFVYLSLGRGWHLYSFPPTVSPPAPSSFPTTVQTRSLNATSIEVSWSPPGIRQRNGRLTGYQVRYFEVADPVGTDRIASLPRDRQRRLQVHALKVNTYYAFAVRAINANGEGPWSGFSNHKTNLKCKSTG